MQLDSILICTFNNIYNKISSNLKYSHYWLVFPKFLPSLYKIFQLFSSGERPYKCHLPDCGRAFIQLSNLQQHLRNHDAQVERAKNRPFHCNICGKGFATESSLRTHTSKVSWTYIWFNVVILEFQLKMQPKCNFLWNVIYFFYLKRFQSNHAKHFQWNEAP